MIKKIDKKNKFISMFNPETGFYIRSGVIENGVDTGIDPFMAEMPELADIGIMAKCIHGASGLCIKSGIECYQDGLNIQKENMTFENFKKIIDQLKGYTFQCLEENEIIIRKTNDLIEVVKIKDININDEIFNGQTFVKVVNKNKSQKTGYKIKLDGNREIIASNNHLFPIKRNNINMLIPVLDLKSEDEFLISDFNAINNKFLNEIDFVKLIIENKLDDKFYIGGIDDQLLKCNIKIKNKTKRIKLSEIKNIINSIDYNHAELSFVTSKNRFPARLKITKELMRLLGNYVGNGSHRTYVNNIKNVNIINDIQYCLKTIFPKLPVSVKSDKNTNIIELGTNKLHDIFFDKLLGCRFDKEKSIPNIVFNVNDELKIEFLSGLFCDGGFAYDNNSNSCSVKFNTSSNILYQKLCILLLSLNIYYSVSTSGESFDLYKKEDRFICRKRRYRIGIYNSSELEKIINCFRFHWDYNKFINRMNNIDKSRAKRFISNKIISVNRIREVNVVDIEVSSDDHLFITSHGIMSHNCALGGRGDVNKHEQFEEFVKYCRQNNIVPNYTTSGLGLTEDEVRITKDNCGAVAVSEYFGEYTRKAVKMFIDSGIKTNLHFVLGNNTIDRAIQKLKDNDFDNGINAVIFLMHKPVGLGSQNNVLQVNDKRVKEFFDIIDKNEFNFKIGFDSCSSSGIVNFTKNISKNSMDYCESSRFSVYIDAQMNMIPCSFGNQDSKWFVDLNKYSIREAWNSEIFNKFRNSLKNSCKNCRERLNCGGGCPIVNEITLCDRKERDFCEVEI